MAEIILGISAYYHDSAACIMRDGVILAAAQEERFTRRKHDNSFPELAIRYVLDEINVDASHITHVGFYDKPLLKFERLLETYHGFAPKGLRSFYKAIPVWLKEKLHIKQNIKKELKKYNLSHVPILFPEHHLSHAASAFYPSPFKESAILTFDGVGEWATTTIGLGRGNQIEVLKEIHFPHSLGLLYSAFTYYCGFRVNSGEYKLMGLAPYGQPGSAETAIFREKILTNLIDIREDGSFLLNMEYMGYATGLKMTRNRKWEALFGVPPRKPESEIEQSYCNMALAIQQVTGELVIKLARTARDLTGLDNLAMAGGVSLNSVANGNLDRSGIFRNIWIQPAAGDAGGAVGATYAVWHIFLNKQRSSDIKLPDAMKGSLLGPAYTNREIEKAFSKYNASYRRIDDFDEVCRITADLINEGKIGGWFQGRMEFGPRALGNRSILADARNKDMQKRLNLQIKFREGFRPFAPAVMYEHSKIYFDLKSPSPYMLMVFPVKQDRIKKYQKGYENFSMLDKLYFERSDVPAVTHIDYTARVQTVHKEIHPKFHRLLDHFNRLTGCPVLINTSFNVRGEPIVCTPEDAFKCFMRTNMDFLVIGNYILEKEFQTGVEVKPDFDYFSGLI